MREISSERKFTDSAAYKQFATSINVMLTARDDRTHFRHNSIVTQLT